VPFSMQLDPELGIIMGVGTGDLTIADARAGAAAVWAKTEWRGLPVLWDFRSARFDVRSDDVREIGKFILEHQPAPPPRVAFVTGRDVDFGLARMFEVHREHPATEVRVFRDYDEAILWAREKTSLA